MSVEAAAQALREATRETVRRYSTWYLIQGGDSSLARAISEGLARADAKYDAPAVVDDKDRTITAVRTSRPFAFTQGASSARETGGYRSRILQPRLRSAQAVSMISAWALALVHRHPTCSHPRPLAKRLHGLQSRRYHPAQSPHATSCPQTYRTPLGSSTTKNSTNYYPPSLWSRNDGESSSLRSGRCRAFDTGKAKRRSRGF
jgi:hypothetical protein